ncbi:MAG: hypothetical protein ABI140_13160 [Jatrophihabitantaceae bacterium]
MAFGVDATLAASTVISSEVEVCAIGTGRPRPPGPAADAPGDDESHQVAVVDASWSVPSDDLAIAVPPGSVDVVMLPSSTPKPTLAKAGLAAASADLTTSTSDMPVLVAVSFRSTPGYTSG